MKKIIKMVFVAAVILGSFVCNAQKNNPYNSFGVKVLKSTNFILKDYKEGKIKDVNKKTLDYYSKKLNLDYVSVDFASTIIKRVKTENLVDVISNSKYSIFTKTTITNALNLNVNGFNKLIDKINSEKLNSNEKQFLFKTISLIYNYKIQNNSKNYSKFICGDFPGSCGAAIGGIIGAAIGGGPGMLIGAIIGGLVGSTSP